MAQGKRLVRRDAATGRWMVYAPSRSGATFVRVLGSAGAQTPPKLAARLCDLDEQRAEVRLLVLKSSGR
jgi:hypothetical protein